MFRNKFIITLFKVLYKMFITGAIFLKMAKKTRYKKIYASAFKGDESLSKLGTLWFSLKMRQVLYFVY
jgi:hypothetical protein